MGNRAVIAFEQNGKQDKNSVGIYLHWNGGRDSVEGFLQTAKDYGVRGYDNSYCVARHSQIIGNAIGGTLSLGVGIVKHLDCDNYDNGVYWVNNKFEIVGREYLRGKEQQEYPLADFVKGVKEDNDIHFNSKH